jgi:CheY-like chemotaxis protein
LKVLVADDNPVNRMVLKEFLQSLDISAAFAEDGGRCVEMAAAEKFDLVLMDKEMPVHDGVEATRLIRRGGRSAGAVIIAVTGAEDDFSVYANAGIDDRIMKPVTPGALEAVLKRVRAVSDAA